MTAARASRFSILGLLAAAAMAQVPTPESVLGHKPGDDFYLDRYKLAVAL